MTQSFTHWWVRTTEKLSKQKYDDSENVQNSWGAVTACSVIRGRNMLFFLNLIGIAVLVCPPFSGTAVQWIAMKLEADIMAPRRCSFLTFPLVWFEWDILTINESVGWLKYGVDIPVPSCDNFGHRFSILSSSWAKTCVTKGVLCSQQLMSLGAAGFEQRWRASYKALVEVHTLHSAPPGFKIVFSQIWSWRVALLEAQLFLWLQAAQQNCFSHV